MISSLRKLKKSEFITSAILLYIKRKLIMLLPNLTIFPNVITTLKSNTIHFSHEFRQTLTIATWRDQWDATN